MLSSLGMVITEPSTLPSDGGAGSNLPAQKEHTKEWDHVQTIAEMLHTHINHAQRENNRMRQECLLYAAREDQSEVTHRHTL